VGPCVFAKGVVTYQHYQRLNTPNNKLASDNWIAFDYEKIKNHKGSFSSEVELNIRHFNGNKTTIGSLPRANFTYERSRTKTVYGRQILDWAPNEKFWSLGILNPNRGFSHLEDEQEGLTGFYVDRKVRMLRISLFASYLYVPQLNPGYQIKDGKVISQTEWSNPVPGQVSWQNTTIPIQYELENPKVSEILFQESYGARVGLDWDNGMFSAYGVYKPESQARINATGYYEQEINEQASVRAKPFINHQWLLGGQLTHNFGDNRLDLGGMYVNPEKGVDENFVFEPLRIEPVYEDEGYLYGRWSYTGQTMGLDLNFIQLITEHKDDGSIFSKKPRWHQSLGASAYLDFSDNLRLEGKYQYDVKMKDHVFKSEGSFFLMKRMAKISVGAEILQAPSNKSFWSPFRSNDSMYTNFSYTF